MKCFLCKADMIKLTKWSMRRYNEDNDSANTAEVIGLTAGKREGLIIKHLETDTVFPHIYVCPKCGEMRFILGERDKHFVLNVESDSEYEDI
ncbi:MAG: hypothetical protein NC548_28630 [Lachnospiraceae bacterium]|nr:hypothetical protein [Lachnospiraceae bacterium]